MFVIVPSARAATNASDADIRGPTRTQNACNSCRLRKAKVGILLTHTHLIRYSSRLTALVVQWFTAVQSLPDTGPGLYILPLRERCPTSSSEP